MTKDTDNIQIGASANFTPVVTLEGLKKSTHPDAKAVLKLINDEKLKLIDKIEGRLGDGTDPARPGLSKEATMAAQGYNYAHFLFTTILKQVREGL